MAKNKSGTKSIQLLKKGESQRPGNKQTGPVTGKEVDALQGNKSAVISQIADPCQKRVNIKKISSKKTKGNKSKGDKLSGTSQVASSRQKHAKLHSSSPIMLMCDRCEETFTNEKDFSRHEAIHIFDANLDELSEFESASPTKKAKKGQKKHRLPKSPAESDRTKTLRSKKSSTSMTKQSNKNDDDTSKRCSASMIKQSVKNDSDITIDDLGHEKTINEPKCSTVQLRNRLGNALVPVPTISKFPDKTAAICENQTKDCPQNLASVEIKKEKKKQRRSTKKKSCDAKLDAPENMEIGSVPIQGFTADTESKKRNVQKSSVLVENLSSDISSKSQNADISGVQVQKLPGKLPKEKKKKNKSSKEKATDCCVEVQTDARKKHSSFPEVKQDTTPDGMPDSCSIDSAPHFKKRTRPSTAESTVVSKSRKLSRNDQKVEKPKTPKTAQISGKCKKLESEKIGIFESMAKHVSELQCDLKPNENSNGDPELKDTSTLDKNQHSTHPSHLITKLVPPKVVSTREVNATLSRLDRIYQDSVYDDKMEQSAPKHVTVKNTDSGVAKENLKKSENYSTNARRTSHVAQSFSRSIIPLCTLPSSGSERDSLSYSWDRTQNDSFVDELNTDRLTPISDCLTPPTKTTFESTEEQREAQQILFKKVKSVLQNSSCFSVKGFEENSSKIDKTAARSTKSRLSNKRKSHFSNKHGESFVTGGAGDTVFKQRLHFSLESVDNRPVIQSSPLSREGIICNPAEMVPWVIAEHNAGVSSTAQLDNPWIIKDKNRSDMDDQGIQPMEIKECSSTQNQLTGQVTYQDKQNDVGQHQEKLIKTAMTKCTSVDSLYIDRTEVHMQQIGHDTTDTEVTEEHLNDERSVSTSESDNSYFNHTKTNLQALHQHVILESKKPEYKVDRSDGIGISKNPKKCLPKIINNLIRKSTQEAKLCRSMDVGHSISESDNSHFNHNKTNLQAIRQHQILNSKEPEYQVDRCDSISKNPRKYLPKISKNFIREAKSFRNMGVGHSTSESDNSRSTCTKANLQASHQNKMFDSTESEYEADRCDDTSKNPQKSLPKVSGNFIHTHEKESCSSASDEETDCVTDSNKISTGNAESDVSTTLLANTSKSKKSANQENTVKLPSKNTALKNKNEGKDIEYWIKLDTEYTKTFLESLEIPRPYQCQTCKLRFSSDSNLKDHFLVHLGGKMYPCKFCGRAFMTSEYLKRHKIVHEIQDNLRLVIKEDAECKKPATKRVRTPKSFTCTECNQKFDTKTPYILHTKAPKAGFACRICVKVFPCKGHLYQHHVQAHKNMAGDIVCLECGRKFYKAAYLENHMKVHTSECRSVCVVCGKLFRFKKYLKEHIIDHCDDIHGHICEICGHPFTKALALRNHKKFHRFEGKTETEEAPQPGKVIPVNHVDTDDINVANEQNSTVNENPASLQQKNLNDLSTDSEYEPEGSVNQKLESFNQKISMQSTIEDIENYHEANSNDQRQTRQFQKPVTQTNSAEKYMMKQEPSVPSCDGGILEDYNTITNLTCGEIRNGPNKKYYMCKICRVPCFSNKNLLTHMKFQHGESSDSSDKEDWKPSEDTSQESSDEYSDVEPVRRKLKCRICSRVFFNNSSLVRHMHVQHREQTLL